MSVCSYLTATGQKAETRQVDHPGNLRAEEEGVGNRHNFARVAEQMLSKNRGRGAPLSLHGWRPLPKNLNGQPIKKLMYRIFFKIFFKKTSFYKWASASPLYGSSGSLPPPSLSGPEYYTIIAGCGGGRRHGVCVCVCLVPWRHFATRIQRISLPLQLQREQNQAFVCPLLLCL